MSTWTIVLLAALILAAVLWMRPGLPARVDKAARTGEIGPVLEAIRKLRPKAQPAAYNVAIRRLWNAWERDLAMQVVRELAEAHADEPVAQYWLRQALTLEPESARRFLDDAFVNGHYDPVKAARCGPVG
ncbi:MAG: hypothetical protein JXB39_09145 [Deltaproteobacteria bacterium]|nr:hypothetical protein [Deltaproteobacteria bacterium]